MDSGSSVSVLNQLAEGLAIVLCDVAVKALVVLAFATVLAATMRRVSAAARHLVWLLAVLSLLALPVLSICLPGWHVLPQWLGLEGEAIGSAGETPAAVERVAIADGGTAVSADPARMVLPLPGAPSPELLTGAQSGGEGDRRPAVSTAAWVVMVWAVGVVVALAPIALGTLSLWRLQHVSRGLSGRAWTELLDRASAGLGLRRRVVLLCSDDRSVPMAWGTVRPKVLLPADAEQWAEGRRWVVLLHELAHVKRWDCASHVAARLACALHWFNPLVWIATRRLLSESERACDDLVLSVGSSAPDYAQHLLEIASSLETRTLAAYTSIAMARPSKLVGRLVAILDATRSRRGLTRLALVVSLVVASFVLLPLGSLRPRAEAQEAERPSKAKPAPGGPSVEERSAAASQEKGAFAPIIERFINDDSAKENLCIDLDTGELHTPPADVKPNDDFSLRAWLCRSGVDAICETSKGVRGLVCFETAVTPVEAGAWDTLSPEQICRSMADCRPPDSGEPSFMSAKDKIPATFTFKTREGGLGVLQIVGISDQRPRGVSLRLKRVRGIAPGTRHWIYPLLSRDDGQELRFLWWIRRGRPARLIHGWYTLVDGRIHEHCGFGTSRQADAGPIELGFKMGVEGDWLVVTAGRTEALVDGSKTADMTARTSVPENARAHTSHLLQAAELADQHLTLWQVQWVRDGKVAKTVIYAARLVDPDDPATGFKPPEASQSSAAPAEAGVHAGVPKQVVLPGADRSSVMLDLASGELLPLPDNGEMDPRAIAAAIEKLGRGDLVYDEALVCVRGAKAGGKVVRTATPDVPFPAYEVKAPFPLSMTVVTGDGVAFAVTILGVGDGGCLLEYQRKHAVEGHGRKLSKIREGSGAELKKPTQTNAHRSRVDIEKRLYREIADMLQRGGNRFDGLAVTVAPDLTAAKCTISGLRESRGVDGRNVTVPVDGGLRIEYTGRGIWTVRGTGHLGHLQLAVTTEDLMTHPPPAPAAKGVPSRDATRASLRRRKSMLFTQAWRALREERFKDTYEIADQILGLDPDDQSAKILRDRAAEEKRIRKPGDMAPGKATWDDVISSRRQIVSGPVMWSGSAKARRIRQQLKDKVSLDFNDTPVSEVVAFLSDVSGISMRLDPSAVKAVKEDDPLITLKVEDMPLGTALDNILRRFARLDYVILDDEIVVSTKRGLAKYEVRTYDVRDLLATDAGERPGDITERTRLPVELLTLVTTIIKPGTWQRATISLDGEADWELATSPRGKDAEATIVCRDGELIVKQTIGVHVEIARLISSLRESRSRNAKRRTRPAELAPKREHEKDVQLRRRKSMLFTQGWKALRAGRLDDAMAVAGQILALDPEDESARILIDRVRRQRALRGGHTEAGDTRPEAKQTEIRRQLPIVVPGGEGTESPQVRGIREKLKEKVSLDFADTPITDVIAYLHDVSGVNLMLDPDAVAGERPKITLRLADINLGTALDIVVRRMAKLDYVVRAEGIFIAKAGALAEHELRTYEVRDILWKFVPRAEEDEGRRKEAEAGRASAANEMLRLICTTVAPRSWQYAFVSGSGGADDTQIELAGDREGARGGLVYRQGNLIVSQTPKVHAEVSKLLASIRLAVKVGISFNCSRISLSGGKAEEMADAMIDTISLYRNRYARGQVAVLSSRDHKKLASDQKVTTEALPRLYLDAGRATLMPLGADIPFALFLRPGVTTDRKSVVIEWALAPAPDGRGAGSEPAGADRRDLLARTVVPDRGSLLILWSRPPNEAEQRQERWGVLLTPTIVIWDEEQVPAP